MPTYVALPSFNMDKDDLVASNVIYDDKKHGVKTNVQLMLEYLQDAIVASGAKIYYDTSENWETKGTEISEKGSLYVYSDKYISGDTNVPAIKVGDGISKISNLPFTDEPLKNSIEDLFNSTNYDVVEGGTVDDSQKPLIQDHKPITINSKVYYYSMEDDSNYYYFNSNSSDNKVYTDILKISKQTWKCTFLIKEVGGTVKNQIVFSTFAEFPTIGEEDILYVDKQAQVSYIWDNVAVAYKSIVVESNLYTIQSIL